ncbi:MAG: macrocin O-methyltransferase [Kiritimatiellae bacterium]|nr:macrocin O-methyltransferase [Kiritimatiellia bacterium]MDD5523071.1 macrocin O-methyltransferase [Kiritimatiellia bacterium]
MFRLGFYPWWLPGNDKKEGPLHQCVRPRATYSPWNKDKDFKEVYRAINSYTLVDEYRCFELWSLVEQTTKLKGSLIEIGVWKGGTGALIAKKVQSCGITDPVYLCDTFTGVVKASCKDSLYCGGEHSDTSRDIVEKLLQSLEVNNVRILEGIFPDESAKSIEHEFFRFCHIDVDVYESAKGITEWIWDRIVVGGIVVYDDYGFASCDGITRFVEEQINCPDRIVIHNLNGHAVVVKIK